MRVLQDDAEVAAQLFQMEIADVDAADADAAALDVVKTQQQAGDRGFARAGVAYDRDGFARFNSKAHVGSTQSSSL